MAIGKTTVALAAGIALIALVGTAFASHTNGAYNTQVEDIYVSRIEVHSTASSSNLANHLPYFEVRFQRADGTNTDLCSDISGEQISAHVYPGIANRDMMISLLQMAYLNQKKVYILTEGIVQSTPSPSTTLCFIKYVVVYN